MNQANPMIVSLSPHIKSEESVKKIMWGVIVALVPAMIAAIYFYGFNALWVMVLSVLCCVTTEYIIQTYLLKIPVTISDGSAAITGILLAFNVPSSIPWWQLMVGSIVAVGIAKFSFGGLGKNPFNPALIGRAFMLASFPVQMTSWPKPLAGIWNFGADAVTAPTPLGVIKEGIKSGKPIADLIQQMPDYGDMFLGNMGGCIGEISALAIIIGGIFMLYKKIISWHIPFFYLFSLMAVTGAFWLIKPEKYMDPVFHILTGGVMLGAWFMATDMVTSPMSIKGQILFAIGGGFLCAIIRIFGAYPEGCSYSILIMNAFVPLLDKYLKPKRFGLEVTND
jgi:electron transport complex protein RnfD